jgi:hypothetical protein
VFAPFHPHHAGVQSRDAKATPSQAKQLSTDKQLWFVVSWFLAGALLFCLAGNGKWTKGSTCFMRLKNALLQA